MNPPPSFFQRSAQSMWPPVFMAMCAFATAGPGAAQVWAQWEQTRKLTSEDLTTEALEAYKLDLKGHPNRFNGIYGAAISAREVGNIVTAKSYFARLLKLTESSNSHRPEINVAKEFLGQN